MRLHDTTSLRALRRQPVPKTLWLPVASWASLRFLLVNLLCGFLAVAGEAGGGQSAALGEVTARFVCPVQGGSDCGSFGLGR